ncbi:MAG: PASTA domain-containing protein [Kofleriaceae bacterium]
MHRLALIATLALTACAFKGSVGGTTFGPSSGSGPSSGGSSGGSSSGGDSAAAYAQRPVPDVRGKTLAEAEAAFRAAGFVVGAFGQEESGARCSYRDDREMVPPDTICSQRPGADTQATTKLVRVTVLIEHDTYAASAVQTGGDAWRRMPDVTGKTLAEAKAILAAARLPFDQHFQVFEDAGDQCPPQRICQTVPEPNQRKILLRRGRLVVGVAAPTDPNATDPAAPAGSPTPPTTYF